MTRGISKFTQGVALAGFVSLFASNVLAQQGKITGKTTATANAAAGQSGELQTLKAELAKLLPTPNETVLKQLNAASEEVKNTLAKLQDGQKNAGKLQTAKALVEHAKGKWLGGAAKGIAQAEAALKAATTDAQREAANKDLAKWQADKEAGLKALAERQAALVAAEAEQSTAKQALEVAEAAHAKATSAETTAANTLLQELESFLASDKLDAKLVKASVLAGDKSEQKDPLMQSLLGSGPLMKEMLEAGGAKGGQFAKAAEIYSAIRKSSPLSKEGILQRLALATALELAVPIQQRNAENSKDAAATVDPVKRYQHYEKAYLAKELDPAFPSMTTWQCRMIVNSEAPDHVLAWGREMLRNYRPDHISNPEYGWRYTGLVRTDVAYRSSGLLKDDASLEFFQNVLREGGVCGRRAFFGRFITKSFGLPTWGVAQHKHAAIGRWTPKGWVVNLGANWDFSYSSDPADKRRTGTDFILEAQAREHPQAYAKVLRAQWVGDALGEAEWDSTKPGSGGFWNTVAHLQKKAIVSGAKPTTLKALGSELGEANESAEANAKAVEKVNATEADRKIKTSSQGGVIIPAAACGKGNQLITSVLGGQQLICGAAFTCEVDVPRAGNYALSMKLVTVHAGIACGVNVNGSKQPVNIPVPYTLGKWEVSAPVAVSLNAGKNTLTFAKPSSSFALKEISLSPAKS